MAGKGQRMSEPDGFLVVEDWARLQHYKDRSPPWIKLYSAMLESYEFGQLSDAGKGHLLCIHMLASRLGNRIPNDAAWITQKIGAAEVVDTTALVLAGFLKVVGQRASKMLAKSKRVAIPETEGEGEAEHTGGNGNGFRAPHWADPFYHEHTQSVGVIEYPALAKQLKKLHVAMNDDTKVLAAFKLWAADPKESRFGIPWFVRNFKQFDVGPLTDANGNINPAAAARMGIIL